MFGSCTSSTCSTCRAKCVAHGQGLRKAHVPPCKGLSNLQFDQRATHLCGTKHERELPLLVEAPLLPRPLCPAGPQYKTCSTYKSRPMARGTGMCPESRAAAAQPKGQAARHAHTLTLARAGHRTGLPLLSCSWPR